MTAGRGYVPTRGGVVVIGIGIGRLCEANGTSGTCTGLLPKEPLVERSLESPGQIHELELIRAGGTSRPCLPTIMTSLGCNDSCLGGRA